MKTLALLVVLSCGAPPAAELELPTAPIAEPAPAAPRCHCCWPSSSHGPGRCRYTRAASSPPDACESDPAQRCVWPDAGMPKP